MWKWMGLSQLAAAEQAYIDAEFERLRLVCERKRMDKREYQRRLSVAWLRSADALEILTALRGAQLTARLHPAADEAEFPLAER